MATKKAAAPAKPEPRKLAAYVHVDGVAYGPDDHLPAEIAKQITNPRAWAPRGA